MTIIRPGALPKPISFNYRGTCQRCGCEVEFSIEEIKAHGKPMQCPTAGCGNVIRFSYAQ